MPTFGFKVVRRQGSKPGPADYELAGYVHSCRSDPRPVHVVPQAIRSPNWSGWGWALPVDRVSCAA